MENIVSSVKIIVESSDGTKCELGSVMPNEEAEDYYKAEKEFLKLNNNE